MDQSLGKTYKALRQSKNVAAKALASSTISYAQLLKFEAGKSSITVEKLIYLLDAIDVTFDEFDYSYHYLNDTTPLFFDKQIERAFWQGNISAIEQLISNISAHLQREPENKRLLLNKITAESSLAYLGAQLNIPKRDISILYNYLMDINQWSKHECFLFMNCISIFNDKQIEALIYRLLHPKSASIEAPRMQSHIDSALLSVIRLMIAHKNFEQIRVWFSYLDDHVLPDFNMYERSMFTYFKLLYKFRVNPSLETLAPPEKCIESFKLLECFGIANQASEELNRYRQESHI